MKENYAAGELEGGRPMYILPKCLKVPLHIKPSAVLQIRNYME